MSAARIQLALAVVALGAAVLTVLQVRTSVAVDPLAPGEPATEGVHYDPPMIVLALVLLTVAGLCAVSATVRLRRGKEDRYPPPTTP